VDDYQHEADCWNVCCFSGLNPACDFALCKNNLNIARGLFGVPTFCVSHSDIQSLSWTSAAPPRLPSNGETFLQDYNDIWMAGFLCISLEENSLRPNSNGSMADKICHQVCFVYETWHVYRHCWKLDGLF